MKKPKPLTDKQLQWLQDLSEGKDPYDRLHGQSMYGGASILVTSLNRRGLLDGGKLTEEGRREASQAKQKIAERRQRLIRRSVSNVRPRG